MQVLELSYPLYEELTLHHYRDVLGSKSNELVNLVRQKDRLIDTLLRQVYNPATLNPISVKSPTVSVTSQDNGSADVTATANVNGSNSLPPPPAAAFTSAEEIYAWLSHFDRNNGTLGTTTNPGVQSRLDSDYVGDSSDEGQGVARSGIADLAGDREDSVPLSDDGVRNTDEA